MEKKKAKDADKEINEAPHDSRLMLQLESGQRPSPTQFRDLFLTSIIPGLDNNILLLHRKDDTMKLHRRFSASPGEPELQVLDRIGAAHKAARKVAAYTCITEYIFAEPRIDRHFYYQQILLEVRGRGDSTHFADVGCCVGSDIRQLIHDGFPASKITAIDRESKFFTIGLSLYNQLTKAFPITFIAADVLDPRFFKRHSNLRARFEYVYSANVVHLFDYNNQIAFLRVLAFLTKPGGLIWGRQVGEEETSATHSVKLEGKGERFTPNEFRRMWMEAIGVKTDDLEWMSRLVPYDELRLVKDYKRLSMEWALRMPSEPRSRAKGLSRLEEIE